MTGDWAGDARTGLARGSAKHSALLPRLAEGRVVRVDGLERARKNCAIAPTPPDSAAGSKRPTPAAAAAAGDDRRPKVVPGPRRCHQVVVAAAAISISISTGLATGEATRSVGMAAATLFGVPRYHQTLLSSPHSLLLPPPQTLISPVLRVAGRLACLLGSSSVAAAA